MRYIIMCGGRYKQWDTPRQLSLINGEPLVARTIRMLRENGVEDIAISANDPRFSAFGVPRLEHDNSYSARAYNDFDGYWHDAFYPMEEPVCYIFGDVVFSPEAIRTIVETETDTIEFFASAPPFDKRFYKTSAEPFALKVVQNEILWRAKCRVKALDQWGAFKRKPIMWELWQVIKETPINIIDYTNYTVINDYTCDIDEPEDVEIMTKIIKEVER